MPLRCSKMDVFQQIKTKSQQNRLFIFGSKAKHQKLASHSIVNILENLFYSADSVGSLGLQFHAEFSFSKHIQNTCKACFLQRCDLIISNSISPWKLIVLAVNAFVSNHLAHCNSLFRSLDSTCMNPNVFRTLLHIEFQITVNFLM